MWPSAQLAQVFPPEVKKASEPFVCQCRCNHQLSACDMFGCGSAIPLREEIQGHLKQGKSQQQIVDAFVAKYGQNILSAPPKSAWVTPFAVLSCGLILVFFVIKAWTQRKPKLAAAPAAVMNYLFASYTVIWLLLFAYVISIARRQKKVQDDLSQIQEWMDRQKK